MVSHELQKGDQPAPNPTNQLETQQQTHPSSDGPYPQREGAWEHVGVQDTNLSGPGSSTMGHKAPSVGNCQINLPEDDGNVWAEARRQPQGGIETTNPGSVPDIIKVGSDRVATNPFLKRKPVPPPSPRADGSIPTEALSKLAVHDASPSPNPWQQNIGSQSNGRPSPQPRPVTTEGIESDPWANDAIPTNSQTGMSSNPPVLISLGPEDDRPSWKEETGTDSNKIVLEAPQTSMSSDLLEEENVWDDLGAFKAKGKGSVVSSERAAQLDDWSLIEGDTTSSSPSKMTKEDEDAAVRKPPLPARSSASGLHQKWVPSRPPVDDKAETYQIKNIQWSDPNVPRDIRTTPILIQNENGPCPLVALVNALTMTTPDDSPDTSLVQVLRSREQISLNLLLDAVFDELMSPRRTKSEDELPDVSDLYAFLQSLHTGMNVNPRFIPTPQLVNAFRKTSLTHLDPAERGSLVPGTFENTMEMSLYATFSIPLIHGWLPSPDDAVYSAMERQAASYEDVQHLLFREEELERKLSDDQGLTTDEQQLYQDIVTIRIFLESSATQLTPRGIDVISRAMPPGSFAILFRNDHFSTLYCHPLTLQLLSLVTDAGYGTHGEVVWESLVDVNGECTEYLSGDYQAVSSTGGGAGPGNSRVTGDSSGQWSTVHNKRGHGKHLEASEQPPAGTLSQTEQEDRDLALALQLQEEEDERHREEQARRRRESVLSEQYIEQQGHRPNPVNRERRQGSEGNVDIVPPRGSSNQGSISASTSSVPPHSRQSSVSQPQSVPQQQTVRSLIPPRRPGVTRRTDSDGDDAPPSYEQAAQDPAYVPPVGHPSHSHSSLALRQTSRASDARLSNVQSRQSSSGQWPSSSQGMQRRQTASSGRDRECIVM